MCMRTGPTWTSTWRAVVSDTGTGKVTGFSIGGRKDMLNAANEIVEPLKAWDAATLTTDAEWGTDHFDFMLEGVPTFMAQPGGSQLPGELPRQFRHIRQSGLRQPEAACGGGGAVTVGLADRQKELGRASHDRRSSASRTRAD